MPSSSRPCKKHAELVIFDQILNFTDLSPSPIGRVTLISSIENGLGVLPRKPFRIYPSYALVLITRGKGSYRDESGLELSVETGDAILVFPGLAHMYGPKTGTRWDELYAIFDGPAFDSWRAIGVLNSAAPVIRAPVHVNIAERLRQIANGSADLPTRRALQACSLLTLLCEISPSSPAQAPASPKAWVTRVCSLLAETGPDAPSLEDIAERTGVSIATFRRRFLTEVGTSPALWRARRRMEAACHLMQYAQLTFAQMAEQLGYADEYHFSKRFKQLIGVSPSQFRRQIRDEGQLQSESSSV